MTALAVDYADSLRAELRLLSAISVVETRSPRAARRALFG
jgi:hypothetical protein